MAVSAAPDGGERSLLGNGVVGILAESINIWERRAPLAPSHCARLLLSGKGQSGVERIIVQPSTKRIFHDAQYEDVGCEVSDDLSECGLIIGIKQPKLEMIFPDRSYAFFSHTHKAQRENMPLLDKILAERVSLFDYELIVGDSGKRLLAFGKFAGRAGLIDFLHGLGQRYLNLGYSTPFLSLGASHMYSSLAAAKAAVIAIGEEIATLGLPSGISPLVFVFTGDGNVSQGAQEIFKLLPHSFVDAQELPEIVGLAKDRAQHSGSKRRVFQVYGCVVTCQDMVAPKDSTKTFNKADYYAHPDHYYPVFHEKIAPYASVVDGTGTDSRNCFTSAVYDPFTDSYHDDMAGDGLICLAVDILPTEFPKEVSLGGHLFDQFLINEALDVIEAAGGSFHLVRCEVGQSAKSMSYSELEVGADDTVILDQIMDSLNSIANQGDQNGASSRQLSLKIGKISESIMQHRSGLKRRPAVLILGAGRVCRPAVEFLALLGSKSYEKSTKSCLAIDNEEFEEFEVIVASLYEKDAKETVEGIPNATAIQLDAMDYGRLTEYVSQVHVVLSLLPPSFHANIAKACVEHKKHMVTASYVEATMSSLDERARTAGITILCEMGLDPGIDHMMAMKMINQAHIRGGKIKAFTSYCGGLPSPAAANNPLAYKFSWNPAGALRTGQNSATYKYLGEIVHVDGNELYDSAMRFRIPELPAFALECLPNRNSLLYGDLYHITNEASTIFRATLRYEGFSEIMACLVRVGLFETENHPMLGGAQRPTFASFLNELLADKNPASTNTLGCTENEQEMIQRFLGLHESKEIPVACSSAFDVVCLRMEERLAYTNKEQDMVLLHHEVQIEFPDGRPTENHWATLLEFGKVEDGKVTSAMALTVGIPAAIGVLLLLQNKIQSRGVVRPLEPEVYVPALDILEASGIKLIEKCQAS
ncbi:Alanine dehydrogenase/PNT, N-terminal domain [Musa troglodytarum]|uniref:Alanine dehydrogenase/PNT, N-terminal domain n=1 Tax=Musa troglodytarum TaxID=320322 RepID=A0A9E7L6J4_9LILI|nr:Alanine dehydrogenase/PNT, N-terminal domain [Musa troglodytarum]